jgi:hypothetical protein
MGRPGVPQVASQRREAGRLLTRFLVMSEASEPVPLWDGPHDPIEVESTWREFVRSSGEAVVEDLVPEPRSFENADFFFRSVGAVAELKEIQTEFEKSEAIRSGFESLMSRVFDEDPSWKPHLLGGRKPYPPWFGREFVRLFRPPLSRILKKANRQIRDTKAHFRVTSSTGILLLVNDGFTSLEPQYVQALASDLLMNSYSSIDCFVYLTVNRYVEVQGSESAHLIWKPRYSERAPDSLVEFVDDLGRKWFRFLEAKVGPFTVPAIELGQEDTKRLNMRAIVFPREGGKTPRTNRAQQE